MTLFLCLKSVVQVTQKLFTNDHHGESGHNPGHRIDTIDGNLITTRNRRCTKRSRVSFFVISWSINFILRNIYMFELFVVINTFFLFLFHRKMFIGGLSWQTTPGKNNAYLTLQTQRRHKIFISIKIWSQMCIMRVYTYVFARSFELDFLRRYFLYKKRIVKWRISFDTLFTY